MRKINLTKLIAKTLLVASVLALSPIGASAEWKQDNVGWWYTEGDSWATGWRLIDGKWYCFYDDGYMASNTTIDGYYLDSSGAWVQDYATLPQNGGFQFNNSTGEITKYTGADTQVVIPDTIDGVKVIGIGNGAFESNNLTNVTIPASVTNIGSGAFKNCSSLTSVIVPDGVTRIGAAAFMGCRSLTSVNIPNGVTRLETATFAYCTSLTSITIPDSVTSMADGAFYGSTNLTNINANQKNTDTAKRNISLR